MSSVVDPRLLLVGGGRMGSALLRGWIDRGIALPDNITVVEPADDVRATLSLVGVRAAKSADDLDMAASETAPTLAILAVKPQVMGDVVPAYRPLVAAGTVFLSIAAGRSVAYFQEILGSDASIVRAMPNTPSQIGRGVTALVASPAVPQSIRILAGELMAAVGDVVWLEDESLMDAVTAVSGSGPAYVFALIECLSAAGQKAGLTADMATALARATVAGAAELAFRSDRPAAELRAEVTSPGGTTAAALDVLLGKDGLEQLMERTVAAAARRSRELAG